MKKEKCGVCLTLAAVLLGMTTSALAVPVSIGAIPDAGSVTANIDQNRAWIPKKDEPDIQVDLGKTEVPESEIKIMVNEIRFTGQDVIPEETLRDIVDGQIHRELTFDELAAVVRSVSDYLHVKGYVTAIAYLPTQEVRDGVVTVDVMLGKYGEIAFDNRSALLTSRAMGLMNDNVTGRFIMKNELDRALLVLNDIPGVEAHAYLSPGKETGTADNVVRLDLTERSGGALYVDNYGSRYTGRFRMGGTYHWNNLTHVGDQLRLSYLQSNIGRIHNFDAQYELPVGNDGTFMGVGVSRTDYDLGRQYAQLDATGTSNDLRVYSRTPLKRTFYNSLYFNTQLAYSKVSDRIDYYGYDAQKHGLSFRFGFDGDYRNAHSASTYKLMHTVGRMTMENDMARIAGALNDTVGTYNKTNLDVYHVQRLDDHFTLTASLSAQYAWHPLDSSEKMYIGGYNAVRAFPQGEHGGDIGTVFSTELQYQFGDPHFKLAAFYDVGYARDKKRDMLGDDGADTLAGAGLGLIWTNGGSSYARLDYAFPLSDRYSSTEGRRLDGMFWFQFVQKI